VRLYKIGAGTVTRRTNMSQGEASVPRRKACSHTLHRIYKETSDERYTGKRDPLLSMGRSCPYTLKHTHRASKSHT
jgi:hypothetical protein